MRPTVAFPLGMLVTAIVVVAALVAPPALGGDDCTPPKGGAAMAAPAAGKTANPTPKHEAEITNAFLKGMVGDWGCDCAYPTGGHAQGTGSARMVLDGTAVETEAKLDWKVGDKNETFYSLAIWKVGADGKSLMYWGFSSHDNTPDMMTGTVSDDGAMLTGQTRWGPMRMEMKMKDGSVSQHLWIDHQDMGTVTFSKK
jgi:hypothetical protein